MVALLRALRQKRSVVALTVSGIYTYDNEHPVGGKGYTENDPANFAGSFYSFTKSRVEDVSFPSRQIPHIVPHTSC